MALLNKFASDRSDDDVLLSCLDKAWASDIHCVEQYEENHMLEVLRM